MRQITRNEYWALEYGVITFLLCPNSTPLRLILQEFNDTFIFRLNIKSALAYSTR